MVSDLNSNSNYLRREGEGGSPNTGRRGVKKMGGGECRLSLSFMSNHQPHSQTGFFPFLDEPVNQFETQVKHYSFGIMEFIYPFIQYIMVKT